MANLPHPRNGRTRELIHTLECTGLDLGIPPRVRTLVNEITNRGNYVTDVQVGEQLDIKICMYTPLQERESIEIVEMLNKEIAHVHVHPDYIELKINRKYRD